MGGGAAQHIIDFHNDTPEFNRGNPFSLTYGVEVVIPFEVGLPTLCSEEYDQEDNELMLAKDLDLA